MTATRDRDALELIQETAQKAAGAAGKVQILDLPKEPKHVYGVVEADGKLHRIEAAPHPRQHKLLSVHQVGDFVAEITQRLTVKPTVWYSPAAVAIVLDDTVDLNTAGVASCPLVYTPQFVLLRKLETMTSLAQKPFVRMLRKDLFDCLESDVAQQLLRSVRSLNFKEAMSGHARIDQGRESLGREIEAEVTSTIGPLPEYVTLDVRVFTDPALILRRPVKCALEVDAGEQWLALTPMPLELDNALQSEMEHLEGMLEQATDVPVIYGTP